MGGPGAAWLGLPAAAARGGLAACGGGSGGPVAGEVRGRIKQGGYQMTLQALDEPAAQAYTLFDPGPWKFPPPLLPVLPVLRRGALGPCRERPQWAAGQHRWYTRARYALRDAFASSGVGPGGALLAPAYHCRTMIDPAIALKAPLLFFKLTAELRPDLEHVAHQLQAAPVPVRAVLMPHFFGLAQDLRPLAELCSAHGARLVEDCAHALPLATPGAAMGRTGDWCIASPYKFFPCADGGVLWSGKDLSMAGMPRLRPPPLRASLRQLLQMRDWARRRAPGSETGEPALTRPSSEELASLAVRAVRPGTSSDYKWAEQQLACSAASRWLIARTDIGTVIERRRANYRAWVQASAEFSQARPLLPRLGEHDAPYMFPLLISEPTRQFARIKRAGVPVYRWDSLADSACTTAADYRLQLIHLPCHQGLRPQDMNWLMATVRRALAGPVERVSA